MLKEYPKFNRGNAYKQGEVESFYNRLSSKEKKLLADYLEYRRGRGITSEEKVKDIRRYILHIRAIAQKEFRAFDLSDLRGILAVISSSRLSDCARNTIKTDLKNFLKYLFPDWSLRFSGLEDIRLETHPRNERKLNSQSLLLKEDIEKIMRHETKMFWKAFLLTQYEGGLRTIETRFLKWGDIKFNVDGDISEISIYATKTKKERTIFVKEATFYLKKLMEEQENLKQKGLYVFHAKRDINKPITKSAVGMWFREITKMALGRQGWNYLLRHSRGTELYRLARQGKIAKDTAIDFMGHSEDMSKVYSHFDKAELKEMLKNQVYHIEELPEEKKHELEKDIIELKKENRAIWEQLRKIASKNREYKAVSGSKNEENIKKP